MRILFIGDVVGNSGLDAILTHLPKVIADWKVDFALVNGENAASTGFGITEEAYEKIITAGADVVTLGNHSWNRKEALGLIERVPRLIRPINYIDGAPGNGAAVLNAKNGKRVLVINALGRLFMEPTEDPFGRIDRELTTTSPMLGDTIHAIIVDFHCEATGEKQAAGRFCDGRASLVAGTHTHTPSADYQILRGGTAFITDVGMTGDYDSVVGMQADEPLRRFTTGIPAGRFEAATGPATMCGVAVETNDATGLALRIAPVRIGGRLKQARPSFWTAKP
ncbi:MAG: YmdB family metallophosphoesterase [Bradyrhizobium sp.]|nr:YmdB family metallophosphoesterase [Bradyrhizobium sp.]